MASILSRIKRSHIEEAFSHFKSGTAHDFGDSTKYDVIFEGRRYPPKAIVGLAAIPLLSRPLTPKDFVGGQDSACFALLRRHGFQIVGKPSPTSWIMQGNSTFFDFDRYLRQRKDITWAIGQEFHAPLMKLGQRVFIWRAKQGTTLPCGVVATCRISGEPVFRRAAKDSDQFANYEPTGEPYLQLPLTVESLFLTESETLKKEVIAADPRLSGLLILRSANQTTFPLQANQSDRLSELLGLERDNWESKGWDEAGDDDPAEKQLVALRVRRGQTQFRANLLRLYSNRCAITGTAVESVLEACHVCAHSKSGINQTGNGILLRSDIHALFDEGLITIDPKTMSVCVDGSLKESEYQEYHGEKLGDRSDGSSIQRKYLLQRLEFPV